MIVDLCNKIIERPNAVDFKALIEEVKRVGVNNVTLEETNALTEMSSVPEVEEGYKDFLDELKKVIWKALN